MFERMCLKMLLLPVSFFLFPVLKPEVALYGQEPINPSVPLRVLNGMTSSVVPNYIMVLSSGCSGISDPRSAAERNTMSGSGRRGQTALPLSDEDDVTTGEDGAIV